MLASAADIVKHFVEEYHEKLEEDFLFPRFRKAGKLVNLVDTLLAQHKAGRVLTAQIRELASLPTLKYVSDKYVSDADKLANASPQEYDALGDDFEKKEDELFGEDGFFKVVDQVAELEKKLGLFDLSQFTPK